MTVRPQEHQLDKALQEYARHQHLPMDILVEELARQYGVAEDALREEIERRGLSSLAAGPTRPPRQSLH